ncbi:MAG: hypothetical protein R2824_22235 [Saprospiraceae bacterium]
MKLPILAQPVSRNITGTQQPAGVIPSIDYGCIVTKCGAAGLGCVAAYFTGGVAGLITCLGSAAPGCIACFTS